MRVNWTALVLIGVGVWSAPVRAETVAQIMIDPGAVDRTNSPTRTTLRLKLPATYAVAVVHANGVPTSEVQLVPAGDGHYQVLWVEPNLPAGRSRLYELAVEQGQSRRGFEFAQREGARDITYAGKGVLRYMNRFDPNDFDNTFKPFHQVFDLGGGTEFITKGAGGSFTHHRGLFFGFNRTQYGDFWHCKDGVSQRFDRFIEDQQFAGPIAAREASVVNWADKSGQPVARDTRAVTAWQVADSLRIFDWVITLEALKDDGLKLDGDPQHAGFHFRAAQEVAEGASGTSGGSATYVRPASARFTRNDEWLETPWVACSFVVKGNPYTVLHMDHPDNPRPVTYSTRAYGRFGAFFKGAVEKGKPMVLKYRIAVVAGQAPDQATLTRMYSDYTSPATVQGN
jgi:hypothetical protein